MHRVVAVRPSREQEASGWFWDHAIPVEAVARMLRCVDEEGLTGSGVAARESAYRREAPKPRRDGFVDLEETARVRRKQRPRK